VRRALLLALLPLLAHAQEGTRELGGQLGSRATLLVLHSAKNPDGSWRLAGEYIVLPTLQRRFLEGEASPEIGVTTLREGATPILFGRSPTGELRGTWRAGVFKGARYAPGGQERERFEFSEEFPSLDAYSASLRCDTSDSGYASNLALVVESGKLRSLEWRSSVAASGQSCTLAGVEQQPFKGGLRFAAGRCSVTVRELGDYVRIAAEGCVDQCGSQAYFEPLLVDRRGNCRVMRPEAR